MRTLLAFILLSLSVLLISCTKSIPHSDKISVFVSIVPQKYFVEKVGKDLVSVSVLVPPGSSPHSYEPRPSQMAGLSRAKLFFTIGVEFENAWIPRIRDNATNLKIVPIDSGIEKIGMTEHHHDEAKHASEHEEGLDPHTWLSPELVKMQAKKIMSGLSSVDPSHKETYLTNYQQFVVEIDSLQMKIKVILANCPHPTPFMVFHPSWGYFAKEFDLQQIPIEIEGKEPSPREMVSILSIAKEKRIKTIFIQPQFSSQSAQQIAHEIGATTAVANDLAENWGENLEHVAQMIGNCK